MNYKNLKNSGPRQERGITIFVVAAVIVAVLGMAALAIDLIALYVAHGQAQRAADAAALAGAKMFVTSGFTSNPSAWTPSNICQTSGPGAAAAANQQAEAVAKANNIAGQQATVQSIICPFSTLTNPTITVKVQQTGLPSYFAKVWGQTMNSVSATSTAEAYNPSGWVVPIQTAVKPWLIPNCDPNVAGCSPMINVTDGSIANGGAFIGESISLTPTPNTATAPLPGHYYSLDIPVSPSPLCPSTSAISCANVNSSPYTENVGCASQFPLSCQAGTQPLTVESLPGVTTSDAAKCMIHARDYGNGQGQDAIVVTPGQALAITGGDENPDASLRNLPNISRSDSLVTLPIYDNSSLCPGGSNPCVTNPTIRGFVQVGINQVAPSADGTLQGVIVNVTGCPPAPALPAVSGGVSPVPVRLIGQ